MTPSGTRWFELRAGGSEDAGSPVQVKQVVRIEYVCRLDDGTQVAGGTASFRLGNGSSSVCAAIDETVPGMCLGDTRRCRAPPNSRRGSALSGAPAGEMLEYDVTLTGYVSHMKIITLDSEERRREADDPLQQLVEWSKRSAASLARLIGRTSSSTDGRGDGGAK